MSESRNDTGFDWYGARRRGIIPINSFKVSKNVRRFIRQNRYECRINTCFSEVMEQCANRKSTWISGLLIRSYTLLNEMGYSHSVEVFNRENKLAGGLYGVAIGAAFFGESMFKRENEADKVALWYCHQILKKNGFELWDTQYYTKHLSQFGCIEIPGSKYKEMLEKSLQKEAVFTF